jgi:hypothetical protein
VEDPCHGHSQIVGLAVRNQAVAQNADGDMEGNFADVDEVDLQNMVVEDAVLDVGDLGMVVPHMVH